MPNSFITLYDYNSDKIYELQITDNYNNNNVLLIGNYKYYKLSDFSEVGNSSVNFDGRLIDYYNNSKIEFDFEIIITTNQSRYINCGPPSIALVNNNQLSGVINTSERDVEATQGYYIKNNLVLSNYSSNYNANTINATINYSLSFEPNNQSLLLNQLNDHFYDLRDYWLKVELVDSNNNTMTNTAPCNLEYIVNGNSYNCKTNGATYIPLNNNMSGTIGIKKIYTNLIDIVNGSYNLKFTAYNKYYNDYSSSQTIPITINTARPINGVSFESDIPKEERIISTSGINKSGNSNFYIKAKYTGNLTNVKKYIRIYKLDSQLNQTDISPSEIFNVTTTSVYSYNNKVYYYISNMYANTLSNTNYTLKSSQSKGNYVIEIALFANNKLIVYLYCEFR